MFQSSHMPSSCSFHFSLMRMRFYFPLAISTWLLTFFKCFISSSESSRLTKWSLILKTVTCFLWPFWTRLCAEAHFLIVSPPLLLNMIQKYLVLLNICVSVFFYSGVLGAVANGWIWTVLTDWTWFQSRALNEHDRLFIVLLHDGCCTVLVCLYQDIWHHSTWDRQNHNSTSLVQK